MLDMTNFIVLEVKFQEYNSDDFSISIVSRYDYRKIKSKTIYLCEFENLKSVKTMHGYISLLMFFMFRILP